MKRNFLIRLSEVVQEATNFLNSLEEGQIVHLATDKELEENEDLLYELPFASRVGKHGNYDEYGVSTVKKINGQLLFVVQGRSEVSGEVRTIDLGDGYFDISDSSLCTIADEVADKLNK